MVEAQTKNQNIFWLWSDKVDLVKRLDVQYLLLEKLTYLKSDKTISDFFDLISGYAFNSEWFMKQGEIPIIKMTQITGDGSVDLSRAEYLSKDYLEKYNRFVVKKSDVLIALTGATIGKSGYYYEDKPSLLNQRVLLLRSRGAYSNEFLLTFCLTDYFVNNVIKESGGGARANVSPFSVGSIKFLATTKSDQQKVEQIIKTAFQLKTEAEREYQEATNAFLQNIKTYISEWDILTTEAKRAFWLWSDQIDIASRIDPDYYSGEGMRNKLGKTKPLGELAEIKIGKTPAFDDYLPSGKRRIMKFRAITGRGIDWENEERGFVKEEFFQKNKQNKLNESDVVLGSAAHQAHYIGKYLDIVDELPKEFADGVLTVAEIMTIRAKEAINPFVLLLFLCSDVGYELIQRQIKGQTSHLYPKDVRGIGIPEAIVKISKSETGRKIESKIRSSLEKSRLSRQKLQEAKKVVEELITK